MKADKNISEKLINLFLRKPWLVFSEVLLLWVIFAFIFPLVIPQSQVRGQIGDSFGLLNTLFAGFAFAVLIITILLQNQQIKFQQQEIINAKEDNDLENLENKFFRLIDLQNKILDQILIFDRDGKENRGSQAFKIILEEIEYLYKIFTDKIRNFDEERLKKLLTEKFVDHYWPKEFGDEETHEFKASFAIEWIISHDKSLKNEDYKLRLIYYAIFHKYHSEIGHYFRHLYHILKYLNTRESQEKNKKDSYNKYRAYADILQAQMSSSELLVLFFNGLCFKRMRIFLYHYKFLENLASDFLLNERHTDLYKGEEIDGLKYDKITFKSLDALIK